MVQWAIRITDLHEYLFPNEPIARAMDLHNNRLGIHYFEKYGPRKEEEIVVHLRKLTRDSVRIEDLEELELIPQDKMVHLVNTEV